MVHWKAFVWASASLSVNEDELCIQGLPRRLPWSDSVVLVLKSRWFCPPLRSHSSVDQIRAVETTSAPDWGALEASQVFRE